MKLGLLFVLSVLVTAVSAYLIGCHKTAITAVPPGVNTTVVEQWYTASGAIDQISKVAVQGPGILKTLFEAGTFDNEYYVAALNLMKTFDQAGVHITNVLQSEPSNFSASVKTQIAADIQTMLTELTNFNTQGGTHIKNPGNMAAFNALIASAKLAVQVLQSLGVL